MNTSPGGEGEQLAAALARRAGHPVECVHRGPAAGYRIEWTDGLTVPEMCGIGVSLSNRVLGIRNFIPRLSRIPSDCGLLTALLLWLDEHPGCLPWSIGEGTAYLAFDSVSRPERAAPVWQRRAEALLLVVGPGSSPGEAAHVLAGASGRSWHEALKWLDRITRHIDCRSIAA